MEVAAAGTVVRVGRGEVGGHLDEDPITRTVVKLGRFLDLEESNFAGKRDAFVYYSLPSESRLRTKSQESRVKSQE